MARAQRDHGPDGAVADGAYAPSLAGRATQVGRLLSRLLANRSAGAIAFLILMTIVMESITGRFLAPSNIKTILVTTAILAIAASAQGTVVVTRNLDISIGAVMAVAGYVPLLLLVRGALPGAVLIPVALALGMVCGLCNGFLVAYARIPALVATLGTLAIYRGLIYASAGGQEIGTDRIPGWLLQLNSANVADFPLLVLVALALIVVASIGMRYTSFGRSIYGVGSNPRAAVYYGLPARRIVWVTYAVEGMLAGFAGILLAGQVGVVTIDIATGWELQTLAAAVIGGVSLLGGSGSLAGAAVGALAIAAINDGLVLLGVQGYWQEFLQGVVIVLAIAFDFIRRAATRRQLRASRSPGRLLRGPEPES